MCIFTLTQQTDFLKFINCGRTRIPVSLPWSKSSEAERMPPAQHMQRLRGYFCPPEAMFSRNWGRTVKSCIFLSLFYWFVVETSCQEEFRDSVGTRHVWSRLGAWTLEDDALLQLPVAMTAQQPAFMSPQSAVVVQNWALRTQPLPVWSSFENRKLGKLPRSRVKSSCPLGLPACLTGVRLQGIRLCWADVWAASLGGCWLMLGKPSEAQRNGFEFCLSQNSISSHRGQLCGVRSLKRYAKSKWNKNLNHTPGTYVSRPHGVLSLSCVSSFRLRSAWEMMFF